MADSQSPGGTDHGGWDNVDWLFCRDGKWRPVESGSFPLAHGLPARVVRLRGYGNAIVPQAAALFIKAFDKTLTHQAANQGAHQCLIA
jgi:DNA (cytosine-5)-methyltransferase 1